MKRVFVLCSVLILTLFICAGCQTNKDALSDGTLTIGLDDQFMPFEYRDEEERLVGFDIDLANALAKKLGVRLEIKTFDFEEIFNGLDEGEYEAIISGISKTDEREEKYSLSEPYISNGLVIVTRANNANAAKTYQEINGGKVGVERGTSANESAEKLHDTSGQNVDVEIYESNDALYDALKKGEIDYVLDDVGITAYRINQEADTYKVSSEEVLTNEPLVIVSSKSDPMLNEKINKALSELREDGTLKKLSEKWFNGDWTTDIDTTVRGVDD